MLRSRVTWPLAFLGAIVTNDVIAGTARSCEMCNLPLVAEDRFERARLAAQTQDYACAQQIYALLMAAEPNNVDFIFGYAQALHWSGAHAEALPHLARARTLAPEYEDIWKLEAQVRNVIRNSIDVADMNNFERAARERFGDPHWLDPGGKSRPDRYQWSVAVGRDYLNSDVPDWEHVQVVLIAALTSNLNLSLTAAQSRRFDVIDRQWGSGLGIRVDDKWTVGAGASQSSSPAHMPEREYWLNVSRKTGKDWMLYLRLRDRQYRIDSVHSANISIERYVGDYRIEYALGASLLGSESATGHRIAVDRYLNSGATLGLTVALGDEIETVGPDQLLRTNTATAVLSAKFPMSAALDFGLTLGIHEQGDIYRRTMLGFSIAGAF